MTRPYAREVLGAPFSLDPPKHPGDLTGLAFQAGG